MLGIGIPEFMLILIVGLIVFGPNKLPELGRVLGKGLREFRKASSALSEAIQESPKPAPKVTAPSKESADEAEPEEVAANSGAESNVETSEVTPIAIPNEPLVDPELLKKMPSTPKSSVEKEISA